MLSQLLAQFLPALIDALTPMLVAVIAALIYRWTGVQVEQKHMLALQSALQNGARLLLAGKTVDDAIDYVARSVPDALETFRSGDRSRIAELLAPHIAALPKNVIAGGGPLPSGQLGSRAVVIGAAGGVSTQ
ncbi:MULTISPECIES: hypothetical protein [unclassified Shinella]|uniref:hypothetical protein n=1 Tax=unclassified Shinella TaxID=2643062 RepID=UPI00068284D4|nr:MULTISPECIES: hypothetical protein [unclassified Shinella]